MNPKLISPVAVGLLALVLYAAVVSAALSQVGWDATVFTGFGVEATATTEYAEARLGPVFLRGQHGHDGKEFFVLANDPWILHPEENLLILDAPYYRSQRMLYPLLAGGAGLFGPEAIIWMLMLVNVVSMGMGSWAVASLASDLGGSCLWGMAFALNIGFASDILISGAGIVAGALFFWGIVMTLRGQTRFAVTWFTLAVLAREVMLVGAAGTAFWLLLRGRRREAGLTIGVPLLGFAAWAVYVRSRIGWSWTSGNQGRSLGPPFGGLVEAIPGWTLEDPLHLAAGVAMLLLIVVTLVRFRTSSSLISWSTVGFAVLAIFLAREVWQAYYDITRAVAPITTAFVLLAFANTPIRR